jgi:uncharacterized membrane protein YedE/YeeE
MVALYAFAAGLVFGTGLIVAGMWNPAKVLAFLDLAGRFDPTLAVVMVTAIPVAAIAHALARRRNATLLGGPLWVPTNRVIDRPLVVGALVFGAGWGLAGICPGPAVVLMGAGRMQGVVFMAAMLAGMGAFELADRMRARGTVAPPRPVEEDA